LGALHLASGDIADGDVAVAPIDLPGDVADEVYEGARGRAIAFVREGRLFVVAPDPDIVFALEPAQGDTPPVVMAIARELVPDAAEPYEPYEPTAVLLTHMTFEQGW
jgi:hypothetical protein